MEATTNANERHDHFIALRKRLSVDALMVQDACNLSGVARSFANAMSEIWDLVQLGDGPSGTEAVNRHPIAILWSSKIVSLTGSGPSDSETFSWAYRQVCEWAGQF